MPAIITAGLEYAVNIESTQDSRPRAIEAADADRVVVAVLARDNAQLRRNTTDLRLLAGWLGLLDDDAFRASVQLVMRHRGEHQRGAPIGPVLAARYGRGDGERALSAALMRRDFEARLREVAGLAVIAKAKGVPVCLVELLRFALWQESTGAAVAQVGSVEQAQRADINLRWMMDFQGAVARQHHLDGLTVAE